MRNPSQLSYRRRVNRVVAHVHAHLDADLDSALLADVAAMSRFHFHRVFAAMTGVTPAHYVLRVRLSAAVAALRGSARPVGEIALDCGFDTGTSLAKAMRREYGLSPSGARQALADPRIGLSVAPASRPTSRRKTMLQPTIHHLPAQQVLCATERGAVDNNMSAAAQRAFGRLFPGAEALGVTGRSAACLALCPDEKKSPDDAEMRFIAALAFDGPMPDLSNAPGLSVDTVAAGRWAAFRHIGPYDTLWQTWDAIYRDWLPSAGVSLRDAAPYELYVSDASKTPSELLITDIHIPID